MEDSTAKPEEVRAWLSRLCESLERIERDDPWAAAGLELACIERVSITYIAAQIRPESATMRKLLARARARLVDEIGLFDPPRVRPVADEGLPSDHGNAEPPKAPNEQCSTESSSDPNSARRERFCRMFAFLYEQLLRIAATKAPSMGGSPSSLAQETICHLISLPVPPKDEKAALAIGCRLMEWLCIDHVRSTMSRQRRERDASPSCPGGPAPAAGPNAESQRLSEALIQLGELHPRMAEALMLSAVCRMSQEQIAATLEVSVQTIRRDLDFAKTWVAARLQSSTVRDALSDPPTVSPAAPIPPTAATPSQPACAESRHRSGVFCRAVQAASRRHPDSMLVAALADLLGMSELDVARRLALSPNEVRRHVDLARRFLESFLFTRLVGVESNLWNDHSTGSGRVTSSTTLRGHEAWVTAATFSPDGSLAATASGDATARIWHVASGTLLATLRGHEDLVRSVAFDPDGHRLATASADGTARLWDVRGGVELATLRGHEGEVYTASFSPDGRRVLTASEDGTSRIWDSARGTELAILRGHGASVNDAIHSPDGRMVATASSDGTSRLWECDSGRMLAVLSEHGREARSISFDCTGRRVLTTSGDLAARAWCAMTGRLLATFQGHSGTVIAAAFAPDGTRVATVSEDGSARIWCVANGRCEVSCRGHTDWVRAVRFSRDGRWIITAGDRTARIWHADLGIELAVLHGHDDRVDGVELSADGTLAATMSDDGTARLWRLRLGAETEAAEQVRADSLNPQSASARENEVRSGLGSKSLPATGACGSDNGGRLVTVHGSVARVRSTATGEQVACLLTRGRKIAAIAISADHRRIITAGDSSAQVWDTSSARNVASLEGHSGLIRGILIDDGATRALTWSDDATARIWDIEQARTISVLEGHDRHVEVAAFDRTGSIAATTSLDGIVHLWIASGGGPPRLQGHSDRVISMSIDPASERLATASLDGTVRVWLVSTGEQQALFSGHHGDVYSARFSPAGDRVVTASVDCTARVWATREGREILVLDGHDGPVRTATFSPDGSRIVTASDDGTARVWDATSGEQQAILRRNGAPLQSASFVESRDCILTISRSHAALVWHRGFTTS